MFIPWFISGFVVSLSLCLDFGIVNIAIVKEVIQLGFWPSFLIGVGSSFGDLTYAIIAMTGVSLLLGFSGVRWVLWIGGTLVLLYFTYKMLRSAWNPRWVTLTRSHESTGTLPQNRSHFKSFLSGWGLAMASPTAIVWFGSVGGSMIARSPVSGFQAVSFFLSGFFAAGLLWSLALSILAVVSGRTLGTLFIRVLSISSALLFLYFAIDIFIEGYGQFID